MKLLLSLTLILFSTIQSHNLRNLFLADTEKYKKLTSLANKVLYQMYKIKNVDFEEKTTLDIGDNKNFRMTIKISQDEDQTPPPYKNVIISISDGVAKLPDIEYPKNVHLELVGTKHSLKEEFQILGNAIAQGYDLEGGIKGSVIIYKSEDIDNVQAQSRFRLMVRSQDDTKIYGYVEIVQEDLNDGEKIILKIKKYYQELINLAQIALPELKLVVELASSYAGILKDFSASSFFSIKYISTICLLLLL